MDEKKKLYCFKLNTETGEIKRIEISDYVSGKFTTNKKYLRYKYKGAECFAYSDEFDRFKNNHVYSYDGNINNAVQIIYKSLMGKRDKEYKEYKKHYDLMCNIASLYMNNNEVAT